jgi:hypothetical protein
MHLSKITATAFVFPFAGKLSILRIALPFATGKSEKAQNFCVSPEDWVGHAGLSVADTDPHHLFRLLPRLRRGRMETTGVEPATSSLQS